MVYIYMIECYSALKKKESSHLQQYDGPGGDYAEWNKSDRERHIQHDLTYI